MLIYLSVFLATCQSSSILHFIAIIYIYMYSGGIEKYKIKIRETKNTIEGELLINVLAHKSCL